MNIVVCLRLRKGLYSPSILALSFPMEVSFLLAFKFYFLILCHT